jgi:hypothetical protein
MWCNEQAYVNHCCAGDRSGDLVFDYTDFRYYAHPNSKSKPCPHPDSFTEPNAYACSKSRASA